MNKRIVLSWGILAGLLVLLATGCTTAASALEDARASLAAQDYYAAASSAITSIEKAAKSKKVDASEPAALLKEIMETAESDYLARINSKELEEDSVEKFDGIITLYNAIFKVQNLIKDKGMTNTAGVTIVMNDYEEAAYAAYEKGVGAHYNRGKQFLSSGDYESAKSAASDFKYVLDSPYAKQYGDIDALYTKAMVIVMTPVYDEGKNLLADGTIASARTAASRFAEVINSGIGNEFKDVNALYDKAVDIGTVKVYIVIPQDSSEVYIGSYRNLIKEDKWTDVKVAVIGNLELGTLQDLSAYIDWCDANYGTSYIKKEMSSNIDLLTKAGVKAFGEDMGVDLVVYLNFDPIKFSDPHKSTRKHTTILEFENAADDQEVEISATVFSKTGTCKFECYVMDIRNGGKMVNSKNSVEVEMKDYFVQGTYTTKASSTKSGLVSMYTELDTPFDNKDLRSGSSNAGYIDYNGYMYCSLFDDAVTAELKAKIDESYRAWEASSNDYLAGLIKDDVADIIPRYVKNLGY